MSGELGEPGDYNSKTVYDPTPSPQGTDAGEMMEKLLSNDHVPIEIREKCWALYGNSIKLTFTTPEMKERFLNYFELIRLTILESIPKSAYNEALELEFYNAYIEFEANLGRSAGFRLNERELMATTTHATFAERQLNNGQSENVPFFSRLMRMATGQGGNG